MPYLTIVATYSGLKQLDLQQQGVLQHPALEPGGLPSLPLSHVDFACDSLSNEGSTVFLYEFDFMIGLVLQLL